MATIIDAIYESGVLKPLDSSGLIERHHYRLVLEEVPAPESLTDPEFLVEMQSRTTILSDGRRIMRVNSVLGGKASNIAEHHDPVAEILGEIRRERSSESASEINDFFPENAEP